MKTKISESSPSFADCVNMHGLNTLLKADSGWCRKLVWVWILIAALAFTSYNISTQIILYLSKPIRVNYDILRGRVLPFPTVTICNINFIRLQKAKDGHIVPMVKNMKQFGFENLNDTPPSFDEFDFSEFHSHMAWENYYQFNGHRIENQVLQCRWEVGDCGLENFTTTFTDFGLCFVFNGDGRLAARNSGRNYGLRLSLHTQQEEYLRSFADHYGAGFKVTAQDDIPLCKARVMFKEGIAFLSCQGFPAYDPWFVSTMSVIVANVYDLVAVHPYGLPPILSDKGISVGPGFHTSLAVDISKLKNADQSVSNCGSKELKHYKDTPYSTQACRQECLSDYVVGKCGCKEIFMKRNDTLICDPPELFSCVYPKIDEYVKNSDKNCEKTCPAPCSTFIYDTTPSSAPLADNFLEEYARFKGGNSTYWRKNFVELEIYLTSMSYQFIEKRLSYTLLDLLCDVGGALGLLLGASFLTVLEIIDFYFVRARGCGRGGKPAETHVNKVHVQGVQGH